MTPADGRPAPAGGHVLAQLNVADPVAPMDSAELAGFVAGLERINALAEASDGFVWRLQDEDGDATSFRPFGPDTLVNLSVWRDLDALTAFVFRSDHAGFMRRRSEWFRRPAAPSTVLWWVPSDHRPDLEEAGARLERLRRDGAGPTAFTLAAPFPTPSSPASA